MSLVALLQSACTGTPPARDMNRLIEICYSIASAFFRNNHKRYNGILRFSGLTVQDAAIDAIADLFTEGKTPGEIELVSAFRCWDPPLTNDNDTLFFLNRIVLKKCGQFVTAQLKSADPFFAHILNKIEYRIKKYNYRKVNYLGTLYITRAGQSELAGVTAQREDLRNWGINEALKETDFLGALICIAEEYGFAPAIPLNALIYEIKELLITKADFEFWGSNGEDMHMRIDLEKIVYAGFDSVSKKLRESYIEKGKLDPETGSKFEKTLKDICRDLTDGGPAYELFEYLGNNVEGLTREYYSSHYQNIMEYLYKYLRSNLAEQLKESGN